MVQDWINKPVYKNGDRVEVAIAGKIEQVVTGTIIGIGMNHIVDHWIVKLDKNIPDYPFDAILQQHTFIRMLGDNCPFLCELNLLSVDVLA